MTLRWRYVREQNLWMVSLCQSRYWWVPPHMIGRFINDLLAMRESVIELESQLIQ